MSGALSPGSLMAISGQSMAVNTYNGYWDPFMNELIGKQGIATEAKAKPPPPPPMTDNRTEKLILLCQN